MEYLLDTHAWVWFINGNALLSITARKAMEDINSLRFVSIASIWEIAIKLSLNKLELEKPFGDMKKILIANDIQIFPVSFEDTLTVHSLPHHHRDPFDRIIISQGINHKLTIITKDEHFPLYGVKTLW